MLDERVDQVKIRLIRLKWTVIPITYNIFFCLISLGRLMVLVQILLGLIQSERRGIRC